MTTLDITASPLPEADHRAQLRRAMIASTVGTTIEWYDFLLYSTVTGLVFGKLFFPKSDPLVGVLEACGLVRSKKKGRVRTYTLAPRPLKDAEHWLSVQRTHWERRLDSLDDFLTTLKEQTR